MQKNKLNNVIVLNEISSNIVEEAIIVLKPNACLKAENELKKDFSKIKNEKKIMVINEAEEIIKNYISQVETKENLIKKDKIEKRYKTLKIISIASLVINFFCIFKLF